MSHTARQEMSGVLLVALLNDIRATKPRAEAASEIHIDAMPMRTCYETIAKLTGPSAAVLDYAAHLSPRTRAAGSIRCRSWLSTKRISMRRRAR